MARNEFGDVAVAQSLDMSAVPDTGEIAPFQRLPISKPEIAEAYQTLMEYRQGKASLEQRLIDNQKWYTLRHWEYLRQQEQKKANKKQVEPTSAWLFNSIANRHASAMDNFPRANILPREEGDKAEAKALSSVIPVILERCNFEQTYSDVIDDKCESGTGVYGVFWDQTLDHGLGGISVKSVDLLNLFWEPGITEIQDSPNLFYVSAEDNEALEETYPQLKNKLSGPTLQLPKYAFDETINTTDKSTVVDWYYKKRINGRTVLHYCKFVAGQDEPLFASENDELYMERGWYDHGEYPFKVDRGYRCKGTIAGIGYVDIAKSAQEYIDRGDQAMLQNMLFNARPRHFIRNDGGVNEKEYADVTNDFIHVDGTLGQDSIMPVTPNPMNAMYEQIIANKITELKETTGNRDVTTGGTSGGATAASAIAAMQEAGSRLDRDLNKGSYRAFREVVYQVIELIRQFYDVPRWYRILGDGGMEEFIQFSNKNLLPQPQGPLVNGVPMEAGIEVGYRVPEFDIQVTAERQSPYSRMEQNERALQFYSAGFFAPENADASLACLEMMDFDRKEFVMQRIERNGTLLDMLKATQQLAVQIMAQTNPEAAAMMQQQLAALTAQSLPGSPEPGEQMAQEMVTAGQQTGGESKVTARARQRVANATNPG